LKPGNVQQWRRYLASPFACKPRALTAEELAEIAKYPIPSNDTDTEEPPT
jgi:hypothetical protein